MEGISNFYPNLKFTHDVTVRVNHDEFITDVHCKPTDGDQSLHFESCYLRHTKSSVFFNQALRMKRICSKRSYLVANVRKLKDLFRERGYPEDIFSRETKKALQTH